MNNYIKNIVKIFPELITKISENNIEFTKIETSQRGGGKSVYIYFCDLVDDNYEYSTRISDHECSYYSYTNILKLITNDGIVKIDFDALSKSIEKQRKDYGLCNMRK